MGQDGRIASKRQRAKHLLAFNGLPETSGKATGSKQIFN